MNDHIDILIQTLESLSPMPSDDSPQLTVERLRSYGKVITQIYERVSDSEAKRDIRFIKPLIQSFGYGDAYESYWPVIHILEKYPADILRPALRQAIETGEPGMRMWCTCMLGRHRESEDIPVLVAALKDPKSKVRYNALEALAMIGDLVSKSAIEALLNDPVEQVRRMAEKCIEALK